MLTFMWIYDMCIMAKSLPQHWGPWPRSVSHWSWPVIVVPMKLHNQCNRKTPQKHVSFINTANTRYCCDWLMWADKACFFFFFRWSEHFVSFRGCNRTLTFFQQLLHFLKDLNRGWLPKASRQRFQGPWLLTGRVVLPKFLLLLSALHFIYPVHKNKSFFSKSFYSSVSKYASYIWCYCLVSTFINIYILKYAWRCNLKSLSI